MSINFETETEMDTFQPNQEETETLTRGNQGGNIYKRRIFST